MFVKIKTSDDVMRFLTPGMMPKHSLKVPSVPQALPQALRLLVCRMSGCGGTAKCGERCEQGKTLRFMGVFIIIYYGIIFGSLYGAGPLKKQGSPRARARMHAAAGRPAAAFYGPVGTRRVGPPWDFSSYVL